ncbi:MAG: hypothetical protein OXR68_07885 [Alphaproteobacteria bacterium]|nr:hypothetical protein [Alphaproteobacteria bacterium]MDD9920524.1 hypothetical protein [Alphaproteobacteria bacterium]
MVLSQLETTKLSQPNWFNDEYNFRVRHGDKDCVFIGYVGVEALEAEFLRAAVLEDLLEYFFTEGVEKLHWFDLFRFLQDEESKNRVLDILCSDEVYGLLEFDGDYVQIRNSRTILQAAMDLAGVWYTDLGFKAPEGENVIGLSSMAKDLIEENGVNATVKYYTAMIGNGSTTEGNA